MNLGADKPPPEDIWQNGRKWENSNEEKDTNINTGILNTGNNGWRVLFPDEDGDIASTCTS